MLRLFMPLGICAPEDASVADVDPALASSSVQDFEHKGQPKRLGMRVKIGSDELVTSFGEEPLARVGSIRRIAKPLLP